jgi:site-specific DNA-methyltransferase (adenine-specific)
VRVEHGDCLDVMRRLIADGVQVDSVVTDPPYHLTSMSRPRPDLAGKGNRFASRQAQMPSTGFMGKEWDGGDIAFRAETWELALQLLKPGGHLVAFSGTRTYHRMACAIDHAGFEIRDMLCWHYGSGFPKSHNVGKATGLPEHDGLGTALKPATEPIAFARKPLIGTVAANVLRWGTGALNVDGCRIAAADGDLQEQPASRGANTVYGKPDYSAGETWTPAALGRWPANLLHDGSPEVLAGFPQSNGQQGDVSGNEPSEPLGANTYGKMTGRVSAASRGDSGSAARFFYSAKADASDRLGSKHPTVKPTDLMAWLCRLITPPGGTVLDPFAGSGSTGMACLREGFNAILIEREAEYIADIKRRLAHVKGEDSPLFAGLSEPPPPAEGTEDLRSVRGRKIGPVGLRK